MRRSGMRKKPAKRPQEQKPRAGTAPGATVADGEVLLTREHVASRWSVCKHTVARFKELRPVKLGRGLLRYRLSDILRIERAAMAE